MTQGIPYTPYDVYVPIATDEGNHSVCYGLQKLFVIHTELCKAGRYCYFTDKKSEFQ